MPAFQDFNFKLLVVEQLMYTDYKLTPDFRIHDALAPLGVDDPIDYVYANGLANRVLAQAHDYFTGLEIGPGLLAAVEELVVDGGSEVYQECAPAWDGEDDLFDVRSLADLDLLPNLKRFVGASESIIAVPDKEAVLSARGIVFD